MGRLCFLIWDFSQESGVYWTVTKKLDKDMRPVQSITSAATLQSYAGYIRNTCAMVNVRASDGAVSFQAGDGVAESSNSGSLAWITAV